MCLIYFIYDFSLEMCEEEGGGCVELVAGGREIEVTALNVYDYVRKYAQHRMLHSQEKALEVNKEPDSISSFSICYKLRMFNMEKPPHVFCYSLLKKNCNFFCNIC